MKVLVLKGEGLNCERESAAAFSRFGADVAIRHTRELIANPEMQLGFQVLMLPGGFSFGDEVQSGHILGLALKSALKDTLPLFIEKKGLVLGICNGFQTLMKMGVFETERTFALVHNREQKFQDRWVKLTVSETTGPWLKGLAGKTLEMPIRHGEGRIWGQQGVPANIALRYTEDVNGSVDQAAALTDSTGQILGMMPHPEAALEAWLMPEKGMEAQVQLNQQIFKNAFQHVKEMTHAMAN